MNAYVLSVDGTVRSPSLIKILERFNITVCIVAGSTYERALEYLGPRKRSKVKSAVFNPYEFACAYGHHQMYEMAILNGDERALFFEDDATLDEILFESLITSLKVLPTGVILLGACGGLAWKAKSKGDLNLLRIVENAFSGAHAYIMDRKTIEYLYVQSIRLTDHGDRFRRARKTKLYVTFPYVGFQLKDNNPIIIRADGTDARSLFRRRIAWFFYDIIDLIKFKFLGGRFLSSLKDSSLVHLQMTKIPGCRD